MSPDDPDVLRMLSDDFLTRTLGASALRDRLARNEDVTQARQLLRARFAELDKGMWPEAISALATDGPALSELALAWVSELAGVRRGKEDRDRRRGLYWRLLLAIQGGPLPQPIFATVTEALCSAEGPVVKMVAANLLFGIAHAPDLPSLIPALLRAVKKGKEARRGALDALAAAAERAGDISSAVPALATMPDDGRASFALIAHHLHRGEVDCAVAQFRGHSDAYVCQQLGTFLRPADPRGALEILRLGLGHPEAYLRAKSAEALERLAHRGVDLAPLRSELLAACGDKTYVSQLLATVADLARRALATRVC